MSDIHSKTHILVVRDEAGTNRLTAFDPSDITVVSDLSFLIRRLHKFYKSSPFTFSPPTCRPLADLPEAFSADLSAEQAAAIDGACCSPLSFISGAPGTGKTNMVLSRCILRYVLGGQRVLLLAPTHNAVEQMLRGILPVLKRAGIPLTRAYRIGPSSAEFSLEYPEVIGDANLEQLKHSLTDQRQHVSQKIEELNKYTENFNILNCKLDSFRDIHRSLSLVFSQLLELKHEIERYTAEFSESTAIKDRLSAELTTAKAEAQNASDLVRATQDTISRYTRLSEGLSYRLFRQKERKNLLSQATDLLKLLPIYQEQYNQANGLLNTLSDDLSRAECSCINISNALKKIRSNYENHRNYALSIAQSEPALIPIVESCLNNPDLSLIPLEDHIHTLSFELHEIEKIAPSRTAEDLSEELALLDSQLNNIGNSAKLQQKGEALVLAGTIDGALYDLRPDEKTMRIRHVFLDEAGYTSLAKAAAAFTSEAPITFLGDHNQLQPVCEMNTIHPNNAPVCLWALSAAYLSEFLQYPLDDLYLNCYCRSEAPSFSLLDHFTLNTSYRFGDKLASILARHIYGNDFHGVSSAPFEIVVIDAPHAVGPIKNSSLSEANAIRNYIQENLLGTFAILAPYRGQCTYLRKILGWSYKENILTVHRSQGREWDTVILSIVDGHSPYFANSHLQIGKCLLNTAISRAKQRLVIVCDTMIWEQMSNQLVHELINCGSNMQHNLKELPF